MEPSTWTPDGRLGFLSSTIMVYGVLLVLPAVAFVWASVRALALFRRARLAAAETSTEAVLVEGHAALVGVVESADGTAPVALTIELEGLELPVGSGPRRLRWTEVGRTMHARPFTLVLDGGQRILVRPGADVRLGDDLDLVTTGPDRRARTARLEPGARVHAAGWLRKERSPAGEVANDGYRGGGAAWTLAARGREPVHLSSRPFASLLRMEARFFAGTAAAVLAGLVLMHVCMLGFHELALAGEKVRAVGVDLKSVTEHRQNRETLRYFVAGSVFRGETGQAVRDETNAAVAERVRCGLSSLPFVVSRLDPGVAQIGNEPGIWEATAAIFSYGLLLGALLFSVLKRRRKPWWERKTIVEIGP